MKTGCLYEEEISLRDIGDEAASICCAKEALMKALLHCFAGHNWNWSDRYLRFLQLNVKWGDVQAVPLERDSLLGCFRLHYGTKLQEIDVPEWPTDRWRQVHFSVTVLNAGADRVVHIEASVVVAHCDEQKLPGYLKKGVVRCNNLDWAPVLVGFFEKGTLGGYEQVVKFSYERLPKSKVFDFSPVSVEVELEC